MKCTNCGTDFPVGKFCPACGTPAPEAHYTQSSLGTPVTTTPSYTQSSLGTPVTTTAPSYSRADEGAYAPTASPAAPERTYHPPIAPVKRKKRSMIPALIAIVLVAALVVGVLAIVKTGPINSIVSGAKKMLDSGSFTVEMSIKMDNQNVDYLIMVEFDPEEEILNMLLEWDAANGSSATMGIYDGNMFTKQTYDGEHWYQYTEVELDDFFESYLEYSDEVGNIFDPYRLPSDKDDILFLLEELDDAMDGELADNMDLEILADCISAYQKAHNDKGWLEENAGFSKSKDGGETIYTYEPDLYDFFSESLPFFEEAFEDDDMYDEGMDAIDDSRSDLKSVKMEISFGVKSGYLTSVNAEVMGVEAAISFYDFGKTKLDVEELENLMDDCKEGYEKQYEEYYSEYDYYD